MGRIVDWMLGRDDLIKRDVEPIEGTLMSLWNSQIPNWWAENITGTVFGDATLADRVWVASRCQQMNSQQIASMPIIHHGPEGSEPAWVSSPDPNLFPNGVGDAMHAIVNQIYGWGYSCQYITDYYADGFPRTWTVLPSALVTPEFFNGARRYSFGPGEFLDPRRVVQIDRNPTTAAHGTSAIRAYAQIAYGLLAAGNQSMSVSQGGIPQSVLKSERKLTKEQAEAIQTQWSEATTRRNGLPPVLPPELSFEVLSINPADLSLLETQEFNAKALATAYGVPPTLINMSLVGGLTYQNPAALTEGWWRTELRNTATRIMNAFSAQMLPRGQWVSVDARDLWIPLDPQAAIDDEQLSQVAKASPAQQTPRPLTSVGGNA